MLMRYPDVNLTKLQYIKKRQMILLKFIWPDWQHLALVVSAVLHFLDQLQEQVENEK